MTDMDIARPFRFGNVGCSNCGASFGPWNSGFSHCDQHRPLTKRELNTLARIVQIREPSKVQRAIVARIVEKSAFIESRKLHGRGNVEPQSLGY